MHRKYQYAMEESSKRPSSRKERRGYDWVNGIPAWTSVTDCKGTLNGGDMRSGEQPWPHVADTLTARHQSVSQRATNHHQETNSEDRRHISAPGIVVTSMDAAQDDPLHVHWGNGQNEEMKPSFTRSKESSQSISSQNQHAPHYSSSRGSVRETLPDA